MSIEREIVKKLFESKIYENNTRDEELEEASFEAGGSLYKCAFGKYYKDGEPISRDDYFKAKEGDNNVSSGESGNEGSKNLDKRAKELFGGPGPENPAYEHYKELESKEDKERFLNVTEKLVNLENGDKEQREIAQNLDGLYSTYISTGSDRFLKQLEKALDN